MRKVLIMFVVFVAMSVVSVTGMAGSWDDEQAAVWDKVAQSWVDDAAGNGKWPDEYIHEGVLSWSANWPAPQRAASVKKWKRFNDEWNKTIIYELFPAAISVVGNTAVVHYSVVSVSESKEGKRKRESQGIMETLVREGGEWKYLGLGSFEIGSGD